MKRDASLSVVYSERYQIQRKLVSPYLIYDYLFSSNNIHKKDDPLTTSTIIRNRKMRQHFKKKRKTISAQKRCLIRLDSLLFCRVHVLFMLFVFIYVYQCQTGFPYQMMFVSFNNNTTGATCGTGTTYHSGAPEFTPSF